MLNNLLLLLFSAKVFHDTKSFEFRDEGTDGHGGKPVDGSLYSDVTASTEGLRPAIDEFVRDSGGQWRLVFTTTRSSGFIILEHK
jgi:hypothetical protein